MFPGGILLLACFFGFIFFLISCKLSCMVIVSEPVCEISKTYKNDLIQTVMLIGPHSAAEGLVYNDHSSWVSMQKYGAFKYGFQFRPDSLIGYMLESAL